MIKRIQGIEKEDLLRLHFDEKLSKKEIAKIYKVSLFTIDKRFREYKLPSRRNTLWFNHDFFKDLNLLNCYWAGFIAADGCIYKSKKSNSICLAIQLSTKDLNHLERFKDDINWNGIIGISPPKEKYFRSKLMKCGELCQMRIYSKNICNHLYDNFNITERKSLTLKPPKKLSKDQTLSYIVGLIDGDGSITQTNSHPIIQIVGTKEILEWVTSNLRSILNIKCAMGIASCGNYYKLAIYDCKEIIKIYDYISKLEIPIMKRKWDIIQDYKPEFKDYLKKGIRNQWSIINELGLNSVMQKMREVEEDEGEQS